MLLLLGAIVLLVSTTMIVRSATDAPPQRFCTLGSAIAMRGVNIEGRIFAIAHASEEAELRRGCSHYAGPVILPNCDAWEDSPTGQPRRIGKVGPFYSDGTCDGSGGGTHLDTAPPLVANPKAMPG